MRHEDAKQVGSPQKSLSEWTLIRSTPGSKDPKLFRQDIRNQMTPVLEYLSTRTVLYSSKLTRVLEYSSTRARVLEYSK